MFTLLWKAKFLITVKYTWAQRQHTDFFPCLSQFKVFCSSGWKSQSLCTRDRGLHLPIRSMYSYVPKVQNNSNEVIRLAVLQIYTYIAMRKIRNLFFPVCSHFMRKRFQNSAPIYEHLWSELHRKMGGIWDWCKREWFQNFLKEKTVFCMVFNSLKIYTM